MHSKKYRDFRTPVPTLVKILSKIFRTVYGNTDPAILDVTPGDDTIGTPVAHGLSFTATVAQSDIFLDRR